MATAGVFRFRDGKIVEIWNHRHDIDFAWGSIRFAMGFGVAALMGWRSSSSAPPWWRSSNGLLEL